MLCIVTHEQGAMMLQEGGLGCILLKKLLPAELYQALQEFHHNHRILEAEGGWSVTLTVERQLTKKLLLNEKESRDHLDEWQPEGASATEMGHTRTRLLGRCVCAPE